MTRKETIMWLDSLKKDIGQPQHQALWHYAESIDMAIKALSAEAAQPLVLTCDGCRHVGTYDTDFPCSGCIRREKDYYEQER